MAHVLESLVNKLDDTGIEYDAQRKFADVASSVDVSRIDNDDVLLRSQPSQPDAQSSNVQDLKIIQRLNELTRFML